MAFLKRVDILRAYKTLSEMREDPTAQGATQNVSAIRHFTALDAFYHKYGKHCDTRDSEQKKKFADLVGDVCSICRDFYTTNFYYPLKNHTGDFNVGSNFYSAGQVKVSLTDPYNFHPYPLRGNAPLMDIKNGVLYRKVDYYDNITKYLESDYFKVAFAIWLIRHSDIPVSGVKADYNSIHKCLSKSYTNEFIDCIFPNTASVQSELKDYDLGVNDIYYSLQDAEIKSLFNLNIENPKVETLSIPNRKDLTEELKKCFIAYFTNYLRLSTGKCEDSKIAEYFMLYERRVQKPIKDIFPEFDSIFEFQSSNTLNSFLRKVSSQLPEFVSFLKDKWESGFSVNYDAWTFVRHYRAFLDLLGAMTPVSIASQKYPDVFNKNLRGYITDDKLVHLRAMRTKPFLLLAGISGTGKSRIVKDFAFKSCPDNPLLRKDPTSPGNYCLIEVKPNWHDSTELIGYESQIGGKHYKVTPFVKFLAKAMLYPNVPFFVCLDEMNLAPVEQYFAEFLSVLESRKKVNGRITSEPLVPADIFVNYGGALKDELFDIKTPQSQTYGSTTSDVETGYGKENDVFNVLKAEGLRIPENLIVIGTVNMDETTHQFSRKVIDRAMTIEMNIGDGDAPFKSFYDEYEELDYTDTPLTKELFLPTYVQAAEAVAEMDDVAANHIKTEIPTLLSDLNKALDGTPFKIAYRVQNELTLYFATLLVENPDADNDALLMQALDDIMMMKVLPRIEGDEEQLKEPLKALASFTADKRLTNSANKVKEMQTRLDKGHFTSFWP